MRGPSRSAAKGAHSRSSFRFGPASRSRISNQRAASTGSKQSRLTQPSPGLVNPGVIALWSMKPGSPR